MNKTVLLLLTATLIIFSSDNLKGNKYNVPQKITVAGKIDNYDPTKEVKLSINRIGFRQEQIPVKTDNDGNFTATFESYIPIDAWLDYKRHSLVSILLNPGDSLYVHFDGKFTNRIGRSKILNTFEFSGDAAQTNQYATKFQQMYYSSKLYRNQHNYKAEKKYNAEQYLQYLDAEKQKSMKLYDQFVLKNNPNDESKKWALLFLEENNNRKLSTYAFHHRRTNKMERNNPWDVPSGFFDNLCNSLTIDSSMLINSNAISTLININFRYVSDKLKDKKDTTENNTNSFISGIIDFVPDPLIRQLMLTKYFDQGFNGLNVDFYERFHDVADTHIKEPFLKEPLLKKYLEQKFILENLQDNTKAVLKEVTDLSANQIMDEIMQQNKGKVIYVDFWATWCGPCLAEFPNSKKMEHDFEDKNVAFVYICIDSDEKQFKIALDKYQLGGQHYFLTRNQSIEIRNIYEISGIPLYMLIDKNGVIKEKGSHLRPSFGVTRDIIREMLK